MMLKAILALNRTKKRAFIVALNTKINKKLKLQLFVLLLLNVKQARHKKKVILPKI